MEIFLVRMIISTTSNIVVFHLKEMSTFATQL